MPGTTYTRSGPERDAMGRLADFARFATAELDEIIERLPPVDPLGAKIAAAMLCDHAQEVATLLNGYSTADD